MGLVILKSCFLFGKLRKVRRVTQLTVSWHQVVNQRTRQYQQIYFVLRPPIELTSQFHEALCFHWVIHMLDSPGLWLMINRIIPRFTASRQLLLTRLCVREQRSTVTIGTIKSIPLTSLFDKTMLGFYLFIYFLHTIYRWLKNNTVIASIIWPIGMTTHIKFSIGLCSKQRSPNNSKE